MSNRSTRSNLRTRLRAATASIALGLTLAACSGNGDKGSQSDAAKSKGPSATSKVPAGNNGNLASPVGARTDLTGFACRKDDHANWSASGVLKNTMKKERTYLVRVSVSDKKSGTVSGYAEKQLTLAPDHDVTVKFKDFAQAKGTLRCAARVVASNKTGSGTH